VNVLKLFVLFHIVCDLPLNFKINACYCDYTHYYPFCKQLKLYSHLKQGVNCSYTIEHGNEKDFDEESNERKTQHTRGGKLDVKGISNIIMEDCDASSKLA
jgi:hypothetical protein